MAAVRACLASGMINEGALTRELESRFRARYGGESAVACGSGSQALMLALRALAIRPGDEVIVPSYVCAEVLATVEAAGATAVIVDVKDDYLLDVALAADALTPATKAVVIPYVMGIWRDPSPLRALGLPIIEDCAQYVPLASDWKFEGDLAVFSFEASKVLASGEGGMLLGRGAVARDLADLKRCTGTAYKLNLYPLSDVLAALALRQLDALDSFLHRRRELARFYLDELRPLRNWTLPGRLGEHNMFFRFPLRYAGHDAVDLDHILEQLKARGVTCRRPVDCPLHRLRAARSSCDKAEALYSTTLSIPIYPSLTDAQAGHVVNAVLNTLS